MPVWQYVNHYFCEGFFFMLLKVDFACFAFSFCCFSQTSFCVFSSFVSCSGASLLVLQVNSITLLMLLAELVKLFQITHNEKEKYEINKKQMLLMNQCQCRWLPGHRLNVFNVSYKNTFLCIFTHSQKTTAYFSHSMIMCQLGSSFRERNERFRSGFTDIWSQSQL